MSSYRRDAVTSNILSFVPPVTNREIITYFCERAGQRIYKERVVNYFIVERVMRFPQASKKLFEHIKEQINLQFDAIELDSLPGIYRIDDTKPSAKIVSFPQNTNSWFRKLRKKLTRKK